jgi:hypothetical protein
MRTTAAALVLVCAAALLPAALGNTGAASSVIEARTSVGDVTITTR